MLTASLMQHLETRRCRLGRLFRAVVDPFEPPLPAEIKVEQAVHFAESLALGEPNRKKIALTVLSDKVRELI